MAEMLARVGVRVRFESSGALWCSVKTGKLVLGDSVRPPKGDWDGWTRVPQGKAQVAVLTFLTTGAASY